MITIRIGPGLLGFLLAALGFLALDWVRSNVRVRFADGPITVSVGRIEPAGAPPVRPDEAARGSPFERDTSVERTAFAQTQPVAAAQPPLPLPTTPSIFREPARLALRQVPPAVQDPPLEVARPAPTSNAIPALSEPAVEAAQVPPEAAVPEPPTPGVELEPLAGAPVRMNRGGLVTIHAENEEVRQVLTLLSRDSGINILIAPTVSGTVRIDLADVTFDQALEAIARLGNLGVRRVNGLVYVYSSEEAAAIEARERRSLVRVYHLNYIRANDVYVMISPFLSKTGSISTTPPAAQGLTGGSAGLGGGRGAGSGAGSTVSALGASGATSSGAAGTPSAGLGMGGAGAVSGGGASVGAGATGGNSLAYHDVIVVRDFAENLAVIDQIVKRLDVQPPQLLIEAVILSVKLDDQQALGINFSVVDNLEKLAFVNGSGAVINAAGGFSPARVLTTASAVAPYVGNRPGQLQPAYAGDNSGMKFGFISSNVAGFIEAIETFNKVNVLASPRVLVLNKQRAEIQLGQRLGFRNTVTNLVSSLQTVEFLSVGTLLTLRPFISNDGMVRLEIHPEKSTGALDNSGIPQTNTSEITTNIMVPDGATIVIGGLIDDQDEIVEQGIPGLDRLPLVGAAFRSRRVRSQKNELIVLLTPRIIRQGGLPEPRSGLPPVGEMGIPNSGPMPGTPFDALGPETGLPPADPPLDNPLADTFLAPRDSASPAPLPPADGGSPFQEPIDEDPSLDPYAPLLDPPTAPLDLSQHRALPFPSRRPASKPTRATRDPAARPAAGQAEPAPSTQPQRPGAGRATVEHIVRGKESFGTLALTYYGTADLAEPLWILNRARIPDPAALAPGMSVAIPPEAVVRDTGNKLHPGANAAPGAPGGARTPKSTDRARGKGLSGLIPLETIETRPVPPGASGAGTGSGTPATQPAPRRGLFRRNKPDEPPPSLGPRLAR